MEISHIFVGAIVGFIIGLTGVGGGSLMTPLLVLGFGVMPYVAVGTDLLYAAITKCSGVFFHQKNKTVDWHIVRLLACGSIPGSVITIIVLGQFRATGTNYEQLMMLTLSVMLILTALIVVLKRQLLDFAHRQSVSSGVALLRLTSIRPQLTVFSGVALGVLVTLSSVGAGAIGSAILFLLYPRKKAIEIVGTDIAHAVPLTALAGAGHCYFGSVDFDLLVGLLIGGIPAIYLGSLVGNRLSDNMLRPIIALILMTMGIKLAWYY